MYFKAVVWGSWSQQNTSPAMLFLSPPFKRHQTIKTPHRRSQTLMFTRSTEPFSLHRIDVNELKIILNMLNNVQCWCLCSSWFSLLTMTTSIHRSHKSKWWRSDQPQRWFTVVRLWPLILNPKNVGKFWLQVLECVVVKKWTLSKTKWQHRLKEELLVSDQTSNIGSFNCCHRDAPLWFTVFSNVFVQIHFSRSGQTSIHQLNQLCISFHALLLRFLRVRAICGSNCVLLKAVAGHRTSAT